MSIGGKTLAVLEPPVRQNLVAEGHFFCLRRLTMAPKGSSVEELTATDRKSVFATLLPFLDNGTLSRGSFVITGEALGVAPRTVSRVWYSVLHNLERHLSENVSAEEGCDVMLRFMDPWRLATVQDIPDSCFNSGKAWTHWSQEKEPKGTGRVCFKHLTQPAFNL